MKSIIHCLSLLLWWGILFVQIADAQIDSVRDSLEEVVTRYEQQYPPERAPETRIPLAYAYCSLAEYHCQPPRQPVAAVPYVEKALAIVEETSDAPARVRTYLLASICAEHQPEKSDQVLGYGLKALQEARASNDSTLIVAAYTRVTGVHIARQEYGKADLYLKEAQEFFGTLRGKVELELHQSLIYIEENKPQKAILDSKIRAYNGLEKAALLRGDKVSASRYHRLAEELQAKKLALPAKEEE